MKTCFLRNIRRWNFISGQMGGCVIYNQECVSSVFPLLFIFWQEVPLIKKRFWQNKKYALLMASFWRILI